MITIKSTLKESEKKNAAGPLAVSPQKVPFYKNKTVIIIAGGIALIGLAYFLLKKKGGAKVTLDDLSASNET